MSQTKTRTQLALEPGAHTRDPAYTNGPASKDTEDAASPLADALRACRQDPGDESTWDRLEALAAEHQRPDEVAALYRRVLQLPMAGEGRDVAERLGQRAVAFHDEWYDDPSPLVAVLGRVLEIAPSARWAFDRLSLLLTVSSRWDELLALYDRALAGSDDPARHVELLAEAANVAKEFTGEAERATKYLQQLLALRPADAQLAASLERLLERQGRFAELVDLWRTRVPLLARDAALATRARIAGCQIETLGDPAAGLREIESLLADGADDDVLLPFLERIVAASAASADVRKRALALAEARLDAAARGADVVRILELALDLPERGDKVSIRRDIVRRLVAQGRDDLAVAHCAALVVLDPDDESARLSLRDLAERAHREDRYADALASAVEASGDAARHVSLLVEAADVRVDRLHDDAGATALYTRVLEAPGIDRDLGLRVARRLSEILDRTGHAKERVDVLERLADLEPASSARNAAIGAAARLATTLGDADRALLGWRRRLAEEPTDLEALDAIIALLERDEARGEGAALIDALRARATAQVAPGLRRADLAKIASVQERVLGRHDAAVETWREIEAQFGESAESTDALASLLFRTARWGELEALLSRAAAAEPASPRRAALLQRLGDVRRISLAERAGALDAAVDAYREALAIEPTNASSRAGLVEILRDRPNLPSASGAAETLAAAFAAADEWQKTLEILDSRLEVATDDAARTLILLEAATLQEQRGGDPSGALRSLRRAFSLAPTDAALEHEVYRLAEATDNWREAVVAYDEAIAGAGHDEELIAALRFRQGEVLEERLGDPAAALEAYAPALRIHPDNARAADAVVRVATRAGRWDVATDALLAAATATRQTPVPLLDVVERAAAETGGWDALAIALDEALARAEKALPAGVGRDLATRLALWHRDRRGDAAAAERTLRAVVEGGDGASVETLRMLAALQRHAPGGSLLDTLVRLAGAIESEAPPGGPADDEDLDVLREAAMVSADVRGGAVEALEILERLYTTASERWIARASRGDEAARAAGAGQGSPGARHSAWALDRLVERLMASGEHAAAVDALVDAARLPFTPSESRTLRHRGAEIAATFAGDTPRAVALYREILASAPDDARAIRQLAQLHENQGNVEELVALRRHELGITPSRDRRLEIRLDIARVLASTGDRDGQLEALRANLDERPGHEASIEPLARVLEGEGNVAELADTLGDQARRLEQRADHARAASLWSRVAAYAESPLEDLSRALEAHRRALTLSSSVGPSDALEALEALDRGASPASLASGETLHSPQSLHSPHSLHAFHSLDALARLHSARGEHREAVEYLEQRLALTKGAERASVAVAIAEGHLAITHEAIDDDTHERLARERLERALVDDPASLAARGLLAQLYRDTGEWGRLGELLEQGAHQTADPTARLAQLREAADVYRRRLGRADAAITILEEASGLIPGDRTLRIALADALRGAGRLDEARSMMESIVEELGRRRPPERAFVHLQLARIAQARGDLAEALSQLEVASSMNMGEAEILRTLGEVAVELGMLERAERAYRALLLIVRRTTSAVRDGARTGGLAEPMRRTEDRTTPIPPSTSGGTGAARSAAADDDVLGPSEVLFELSRIARARGDEGRAKETLESAFEAAGTSADEARRLERAVRATGDAELLLNVLQSVLPHASTPRAGAAILSDIADLFELRLGRPNDAIDARLRAITLAPDHEPLHGATLALIGSLESLGGPRDVGSVGGVGGAVADGYARYAAHLSGLADMAIGRGDRGEATRLLLRVGTLCEGPLADLPRAAKAYGQAADVGDPLPEVWRALDRVCGALGDRVGQGRALRELVQRESDDTDAASRTDAMYRLAEIELASADKRLEGVEMLAMAIDREPQFDRAARILRAAAGSPGDVDAKIIALYESVARSSNDPVLLLDALEHRAAHPDASIDLFREATDLAVRLGDDDRAERLLGRAIEVARGSGSLGDAVWALVAIADRRKAAGDFARAIPVMREAAEAAEASEGYPIALEAAQLAHRTLEALPVAAEIYEWLRERDPSDRNVWGPLLEIYRGLDDVERLEALLGSTIDVVYDSAERNVIRLERARLMAARPDRLDDLIAVLRDAIDDDPEQLVGGEATTMLIAVLEREGRIDELADILARQVDAAKERGDVPTVVALTLRLGALLEQAGRRDDAADVYRSSSLAAPGDRALLHAILRVQNPDDTEDRAEITERLLTLETGEAAADLAMTLADLRSTLGDDVGVARALDRGFRAHPQHDALRDRLERWHVDHEDWDGLAEMYVFDASTRMDKLASVIRYREAASLYSERLGNATSAASTLRLARGLAPDDPTILAEYARALAASGEVKGAIDEVSQSLDARAPAGPATRAPGLGLGEEARVELLRLRAELRTMSDDFAGAVHDLERAYAIAGEAVSAELAEALEQHRAEAERRGDGDGEQVATLRLVEVLAHAGNAERARDLLSDWVNRAPRDRAALLLLTRIDATAERWEDVAEGSRRLLAVADGDEQIEAALRLADACERIGRPDEAREGLERVFHIAPTSEAVRAQLRRLYQQIGAHRELAELALVEAQFATDDATKLDCLRAAGELWLGAAGEPASAVSALEQALRLRPGHHEVTVLLADAYTASGRIAEVTELLTAAIAGHKGRRSRELATLQHRMARAAYAAGDRNVELAWLEVALDSDMQNGHVAAELAEVAMEMAQWDLALKALKAVTLLKTPGPMSRATAVLRQGIIAHRQGDGRRAAFLAKKALQEDPELAEAERFLKDLGGE